MEKTLSQSEIDDLVRRLAAGEDENDAPQPEQAERFDFRKGKQLARDQMRFVEQIQEQFARNVTTLLMERLGVVVEVAVRNVNETTYSEFKKTVPNSISNLSVRVMYEVQPLESYVVAEFTPDLIFALFERLMGGAGSPWKNLRELTEIEMAVLRRQVFEIFGHAMEKAWAPVEHLTFKPRVTQRDAFYVERLLEQGRMVLSSFQATIGSGFADIFNVSTPHTFFDPLLPRLTQSHILSEQKRQTPEQSARLKRMLHKAKVRLTVRLGKTFLRVDDLLSLQEGDVIPLDRGVQENLEVLVAGREKFLGTPGKVGRSLGVMITGAVKEGTRHE